MITPRSLSRGAAALGLTALAALSACAPAHQNAGTVDIRSVDAHGTMGRWTTGESYTIVYAVTETAGRTAVCGAWSYFGGGPSMHYPQMLRSMYVYIGDERLMQNIEFFNATGKTEPGNLGERTLNCAFSDVPWQPAFATTAPRLKQGQTTFVE
ncbi:hypothetical protein FDP22_11050 [Paroceanicella profunda]|uniref:Lipoprotein n=1 Tax=Paroceanicella profunda TaxID=2579971 RepID=A0A5B8FHK4_9RHOB|nr:hypothetical protein [Paroceanicella profunda]QDL92267.1 hypothetical protein FDP22_11050 [Paroceanicella profunda]